MNRFTATEWAVLLLYAQGLDGPEIAEKLSITKKRWIFTRAILGSKPRPTRRTPPLPPPVR